MPCDFDHQKMVDFQDRKFSPSTTNNSAKNRLAR